MEKPLAIAAFSFMSAGSATAMRDATIAVNAEASPEVRTVGRDRTHVIVIDDFALDLGEIIDYGCGSAEFGSDGTSMYPGLRAPLPKGYVRAVLQQIYRLLFAVYEVPPDLGMKTVNAVYSLITTPEADLRAGQCSPHFDSCRPFYLAVLHYLNPGSFCDTGLFRHRATGLERVSEETVETYLRACEEKAADEPGYIRGSNAHYELYDRIEYRPNRLVAYPGSLLHSGLVDPAVDINPDPRSGRLTANIFVDFVPLAGQS
jgi:hypothetical protein